MAFDKYLLIYLLEEHVGSARAGAFETRAAFGLSMFGKDQVLSDYVQTVSSFRLIRHCVLLLHSDFGCLV